MLELVVLSAIAATFRYLVITKFLQRFAIVFITNFVTDAYSTTAMRITMYRNTGKKCHTLIRSVPKPLLFKLLCIEYSQFPPVPNTVTLLFARIAYSCHAESKGLPDGCQCVESSATPRSLIRYLSKPNATQQPLFNGRMRILPGYQRL